MIDTAAYSPKREACPTRGSDFLHPQKACVYFNDNATSAALGDSHVIEPAYALAEQLAARHQGLVHLSFSGCPPALKLKVDVPGFTAWPDRAVERIEGDARIVNVLVAFRFSYHVFGGQLETYPELLDKGLRPAGRGPTESRGFCGRASWRR